MSAGPCNRDCAKLGADSRAWRIHRCVVDIPGSSPASTGLPLACACLQFFQAGKSPGPLGPAARLLKAHHGPPGWLWVGLRESSGLLPRPTRLASRTPQLTSAAASPRCAGAAFTPRSPAQVISPLAPARSRSGVEVWLPGRCGALSRADQSSGECLAAHLLGG